jgi:hypothetical protein
VCTQFTSHVLHYPSAYVVNSDRSDGPGEHWIAVYFCKDGCAEFFDSYFDPKNIILNDCIVLDFAHKFAD